MDVAEQTVATGQDPGKVRTALAVVAAGALIGAFTVGVISRLAMFVLIRMNPESDGITSDDGFEMGRFTIAGSFNLVTVGIVLGILSGLLYLAVERLRFGPGWFRTLSVSVGAGTVAASQIVHADGVDFALLEPLVAPLVVFVAIPVLHVALLEVAAVRIRAARGGSLPVATGAVSWILRAGLAVVFVLAVASLVGDVRDLTD